MAQELKDFIDNSFKLIKECHKSQETLQKHMINDAKRYRELINFASQSNKKVEVEINYAQHLLTSLISSCAAIKSSTTDMKKELIERKQLREKYQTRIKTVVLKYENKWYECSQRFDSMIVVKKWRETLNCTEELNLKIQELHTITNQIDDSIKLKAQENIKIDNARIINMAKFFVCDGEKLMKIIENKQNDIQKLKLMYENKCKQNITILHKMRNIKNVLDDENALPYLNLSMEMPKLDVLYNEPKKELDHIPQHKLRVLNEPKLQLSNANDLKLTKIPEPELQTNAFMDAYKSLFEYKKYKPDANTDDNTKHIKIINDMNVDNDVAQNIISNLNNRSVKVVEFIEGTEERTKNGSHIEEIEVEPMLPPTQFDHIQQEENEDDTLIPPTQFKDCSQDLATQESDCVVIDRTLDTNTDTPDNIKKKVSFHLPEVELNDDVPKTSYQSYMIHVDDKQKDGIQFNATKSLPSSVENYNELLKDLYLKKYNLDLSPKFVYAKRDSNNVADKPITSKFFEEHNNAIYRKSEELMDIDQPNSETTSTDAGKRTNTIPEDAKEMEVDDAIKENDSTDINMTETENMPTKNEQLFNESLNTTGFDDVDNLPCIDSSLLLSPKGDLQPDNQQEDGTEKTGFLAGIRKTGMSLFANTEEKPDSSNSSNNFTFDFGGAKKNRGGLFNMFG